MESSDFSIVTESKFLYLFEMKVKEKLKGGWKLHGYSQFPFEICDCKLNGVVEVWSEEKQEKIVKKFRSVATKKGQWSQAFIKTAK